MAGSKNNTPARKKRKLIPYLVLWVAVTVILALFVLYGERGFFYYMRLERQRQSLISSNLKWRAKNQQLYKRIKKLRHDPQYIEKTARKELGLVKEGELIYIFESNQLP